MKIEQRNRIVEVVDFSFHWLCLKKEDFKTIFDYIPVMEFQFEKVEKLVGRNLTDAAAKHYYDFDDIRWTMYKDLAFLGLVTDAEWIDFDILMNQLEQPEIFPQYDYLHLCKLLAISTSGSHFSDGFFDQKINNKTILKLLKALKEAIDIRDRI